MPRLPPSPTPPALRVAAAGALVIALCVVGSLMVTARGGGDATALRAAPRRPTLADLAGRRGGSSSGHSQTEVTPSPPSPDAPWFCRPPAHATGVVPWTGAHTLIDDAPEAASTPWAQCGTQLSRPDPEAVRAAGGDACDVALGGPKVALMFLTRGDLPHERVWARWLEDAADAVPLYCVAAAACGRGGGWGEVEALKKTCASTKERRQRLFSLYVHAPPTFGGFGAESPFAGALIGERYFTKWGDHSMMQAVRAMLAAALANPLNQKFVLLSEACAPLYPPAAFHAAVIREPLSRVDACGRRDLMWERWTWRFEAAGVKAASWRKGSQWVALTRPHASLVAADTAVVSAFAQHCTYGEDADTGTWRACVSDESYVPTLLAHHGRDNETDCTGGLTAVDWVRKAGTGAHPHTYVDEEISPSLIRKLRRQDEPFVLCDAPEVTDLAMRTYRAPGAWPASPEEWAGVGPYPAARGVGYQCPLIARKFDASATATLEAALADAEGGVLGVPVPGPPRVARSDEREEAWAKIDPTWGRSRQG